MEINSKGELVVAKEEICNYPNFTWKKAFNQIHTLKAANHIDDETYSQANKILADYLLTIEDLNLVASTISIRPKILGESDENYYDVHIVITETLFIPYNNTNQLINFSMNASQVETSSDFFNRERTKIIIDCNKF